MGQLKVETARRPGIEQFSQMELLGYRLFLPSPKTRYTESHPKFMGSRGSKGDVEGPFNRNEEEKKAPQILHVQIWRDPGIQTMHNSVWDFLTTVSWS